MIGGHLWELVVVLALVLIVVGPKRLPDVGAALGRSIRQFQAGLHDAHNAGAPIEE